MHFLASGRFATEQENRTGATRGPKRIFGTDFSYRSKLCRHCTLHGIVIQRFANCDFLDPDFLIFNHPDFEVPRFPDFEISKHPNFQPPNWRSFQMSA